MINGKDKLDIIKLILDVSNKINRDTKTDIYLQYGKKYRDTDTGYAIDGIIFFQECLIDEINKKYN